MPCIITPIHLVETYPSKGLEDLPEVQALITSFFRSEIIAYSFRHYKDTNIYAWFRKSHENEQWGRVSNMVTITILPEKNAKGSRYDKEKQAFCLKYKNDIKKVIEQFEFVKIDHKHTEARKFISLARQEIGYSLRTADQDIWCSIKKACKL